MLRSSGATWFDLGGILGNVRATLGPFWEVLGAIWVTLGFRVYGFGFDVWGLIITTHAPLKC